MDVLKNISKTIKSGWDDLSRLKRIGLVSILTLIVLVGGVVSFVAQKTEYALLFSEIEAADSGAIVSDLDAQGISYRLEDNGTTIYIDAKHVDKYRINLAVNDMLPSSSVGFEIFDSTSMMATDEDRKIMQQRAIQGELERAIGALSGVESVKVLLSIPEKSVFTRPEDTLATTASVIVATTGNNTLSTSAIQGMAALVSGAVDNLPIENVSIVDQSGKLLSGFIQSGTNVQSADLASQNRQIESEYALELERKLLATLAPVYGVENLSVSVNVRMNFDIAEEEVIDYGSNGQTGAAGEGSDIPFVRSQDISASGGEIGSGDGALSGNDVSVTEIIEGESGNTAQYNSTTNYEFDTTTKRPVLETGAVENISVSILYNESFAVMEQEALQTIAMGVVGTTERNDVQVTGARFLTATTPEVTEPVVVDSLQTLWDDYKYYLIGIGGFMLVSLIIAVVISGRRRRREEEDEFEEVEDNSENMLHLQAMELAEKDEKDSLQELLQGEKLKKETEAHNHAKENPAMVADLLKMWMKDE
ncbi:flagellar basal-body MS-ring/collar protein FliF [Jeotgalibaca porci]|uniref:flagellar basal-body MS-ring/collar protein FliF n=1 Tax=Jeotgalibaca porci TaxID=1868793 RepID=UPI00359F2FB9